VAEFLVELYAARDDAPGLARCAERARRVAERLDGDGTPVRYLRSIFMPEDETCFLLYEAASREVVHAAATQAELTFDRIIEAVPPS
jgi:hypothetical protein